MILDGVRVLDFTQYLAGPVVTRLMAEMGAEIIKVERGPDGDPTRILAVMKNGRSADFVQQSLGKKNLCLDLAKPESQSIIDGLVAECDVVVENFSKRVVDKRKLDYASLAKINPSIIVASVSAFGRDSPYANKTGYDWIAQGFTGHAHDRTERRQAPSGRYWHCGFECRGTCVFGDWLRTLLSREDRQGQYLDISMVDALYHMNEITVQGYQASDGAYVPMRAGEHHALLCPCGVYKSAESYMVLLVLQNQWPGLCEAMGRQDLTNDARFADQDLRAKNQVELIPIIETWLQTFASDAEALGVLRRTSRSQQPRVESAGYDRP